MTCQAIATPIVWAAHHQERLLSLAARLGRDPQQLADRGAADALEFLEQVYAPRLERAEAESRNDYSCHLQRRAAAALPPRKMKRAG